jgi:ferric-dicitrate binding protein FerR (iron transport regulator)
MTTNRAEELWTRLLAGPALTPAEEAELLRALETDPALRDRLLADGEFDGLLDALHATDREASAFARAFQERLAMEEDQSRFVARIEERIRRSPVRRLRRTGGGTSPWVFAFAAAGLFAVLIAAFVASSPRPSPTAVRTPPRPEPPPPDPAPPVEVPRIPKPVEEPRPVPPPPIRDEPPAPAPVPRVEERPAPPPPPKERPTVPEAKPVERAVARIDRIEGEVVTDRRPAQAGQDLAAGRGVEVGPKSSAAVVYPDRTRVELGSGSTALGFEDAATGKTLVLEKGALAADVVKQPAGRPMTIRTPHAEVRVIGTAFRLAVEAASTRLDVTSGRVRLTRSPDGRSVEVGAGQYAVAGPGLELAAKSSAPKPRPVFLREDFQDPRGVDGRWKPAGAAATLKTSGRLEVDFQAKAPGPDGWSGAGLVTRQAFAAPLALELDVDVPVLHASVVAAAVFIPQGQKRGGAGVFRVQLRDQRYSITAEAGEVRELAGADRTGGAPCRERWRIEIDGNSVRLLAGEREVLRHRLEPGAAAGYVLGIDGSARSDAPSGAKAAFDNVVLEPLR